MKTTTATTATTSVLLLIVIFCIQPLDGTGLLRHYMVQCMQYLREEEFAEGIQRNRNVLQFHSNNSFHLLQ